MKVVDGGQKIDFSQAHFLDHSFWSCTPGDLRYGGKRVHLLHLWQFRWRDALRERTTCRVGRHRWVTATKYRDGVPGDSFLMCCHCGFKSVRYTP